ncbi:E3 ubiquitin-protein ligase TRIM39-like, partial [Pseudonaja textilis]|uniref:E3 ubiquitin-protein ligase TRIM39-like n=1 Tax=Pseudonaja textilis TaxID=8673 RepID=UPI000EA895EA
LQLKLLFFSFLSSFLPFPLTVNVTLDPDTTNPDCLKISEDRKSITGLKDLLYNPCVLGCQMFSSGRHFWDVIVSSTRKWFVGVTSKPGNFKNVYEQTRKWQIWGWDGKYTAASPSKCCKLVLTESPTRIRISLNCEGGQVSFFDAKTAALLHTFSDASLVGETLLPYFYLGKGSCVTLP